MATNQKNRGGFFNSLMGRETYYRAHERIGNGQVRQLPYVVSDQGEAKPAPITNSQPIPESTAAGRGCPIYEPNNFSMQNKNGNYPLGVQNVETANGRAALARFETPGENSQRLQWTITISNGEATDEEFLIGDGTGLLATKLGIVAPKAGVTISGTYGAATYTTFKAITANQAVDLHGLHLVGATTAGVASDVVFNQGFLRMAEANIANNAAQDTEIPFRDLVGPDSFQTNIRVDDDWRMLMNPLSALHVKIPAGEALTVTFRVVRAVEKTFGMNLVSPNWKTPRY